MKKGFWTKSNVAKMSANDLITWNNKCVGILDDAKKHEVEVPATEKAYALLRAEMTKRNLI